MANLVTIIKKIFYNLESIKDDLNLTIHKKTDYVVPF